MLQAAGRAGRFAGTILDDFGQETRGDKDNVQPRLGFVYDLRGTGREIIRGGWGIYTDFGYTNSNVLTAAIDAAGGGGPVFVANVPTGIRRPDGALFRVSDPLSTIAAQNQVNPNIPSLAGEVVSPLLEQPYSLQTNLGWAREIDPTTSVSGGLRSRGWPRSEPPAPAEHARWRAPVPRRPADPAECHRLSHRAQQGTKPLRRAHHEPAAPPVGPARSERLLHSGEGDKRRRHRRTTRSCRT